MANVPTPHIAAQYGEIAETVIMSGDPLRAKLMAERYLEDARLVSSIRNMFIYTGTYKGKRVTVMGHGIGISSISIYSYELFNFYGVERIVRAGTAGSYQEGLDVGDIIIGMGACDASFYANQFNLPGTFSAIADFGMVSKAVETAEKMGVNYRVGNILSSEVFYGENYDDWKKWQKMGVIGVEMEASALYMNAARAGKKALCVLTVSDSFITHKVASAEDRQNAYTNMMDIAFSLV